MAYPYQAPPDMVPFWSGSPRGDIPPEKNYTFPVAGKFHPEETYKANPLDWIFRRYDLPGGTPYMGDLIPGQSPDKIDGPYLTELAPHIESARTAIARDKLKAMFPAAGEPPPEAIWDYVLANPKEFAVTAVKPPAQPAPAKVSTPPPAPAPAPEPPAALVGALREISLAVAMSRVDLGGSKGGGPAVAIRAINRVLVRPEVAAAIK